MWDKNKRVELSLLSYYKKIGVNMFGSTFNFNIYNKNNNIPPLSSICPWEFMVDDGVCMLKGRNGALCSAYEFVAPDLGSSSASQINSVATMFNNAIINLGEGWTIQFELRRRLTNKYPAGKFCTKTGAIIDSIREVNFSSFSDHYENKYYVIFTYELPSEIEQKGKSLFFKKDSKQEEKPIKPEIKNFLMKIKNTAAILSTKLNMHFLNSSELFTLFATSVSFNWHKRVLEPDLAIFLDRIISDTDLENTIPLRLGNQYIPIIAINAFPSITFPAMFDVLNKSDCELRWSTRFMCTSRQQAVKRIKKAEDKFHGKRKSIGALAAESVSGIHVDKVDTSAMAEEENASQAKISVTMGETGFGDYTSNVMVWDEDLKIAEEKANLIMGDISACGFSCKTESVNALQAFLSMQPGNIYANSRQLFCSTRNVSHIIPISSVWSGLKENKFLNTVTGCSIPHVICGTDFNIPYFLNLNIGDVGHSCILGPTGAGKSTVLNLLEAQWDKYKNRQVIIFDSGRSARNLTMCIGGTYIEPGKEDSNIAFQPLAELDDAEQMQWACEFIELLLSEQKVVLNAAIRKAIYETIKLLSDVEPSMRTLTSFKQYCDYINPITKTNEIADGIAPYCFGGQYGLLFDNDAIALPLTDWTMIEMGSLMNLAKGAVAPALFYLFKQCEKRFNGRPTLLVLDEAQTLFENPLLASKLVDWLRRLRKLNVFVIIATQEISAIMASPIASTVISQCPTKIYLADEEAETPYIKEKYKEFGLTDSEIHLLASTGIFTKKRDYFYKSSLGTRQFQLDLDSAQLAILTNSADEHKLLDKIEKNFGKNTGKELVYEILKAKGFNEICEIFKEESLYENGKIV